MHSAIKIAQRLTRNRQTLALAESLSGGLAGHLLTNIPGASAFFTLGVTAYHNDAKIKILHVPSSLLKKHGAVSAEAAKIMAQNVRRLAPSDFGLALTGIAGPTGATAEKPIGLTYVAAASKTKTVVQELRFKGNRLANKKQAVAAAFQILLQLLA